MTGRDPPLAPGVAERESTGVKQPSLHDCEMRRSCDGDGGCAAAAAAECGIGAGSRRGDACSHFPELWSSDPAGTHSVRSVFFFFLLPECGASVGSLTGPQSVSAAWRSLEKRFESSVTGFDAAGVESPSENAQPILRHALTKLTEATQRLLRTWKTLRSQSTNSVERVTAV